jgi:hypothetical protein
MNRQTSAAATGMVNEGEERLSEDPNQGHRAPRDRTVHFVESGGSMCRPGGLVNAILRPARAGEVARGAASATSRTWVPGYTRPFLLVMAGSPRPRTSRAVRTPPGAPRAEVRAGRTADRASAGPPRSRGSRRGGREGGCSARAPRFTLPPITVNSMSSASSLWPVGPVRRPLTRNSPIASTLRRALRASQVPQERFGEEQERRG